MIGIDEVGRGCWAGPLVVVAAKLNTKISGLKDSKDLSRSKREQLFEIIEKEAEIGIAIIEPSVLDTIGLGPALYQAFAEAINTIKTKDISEIIVDGNVNYLKGIYDKSQCVIKADSLYPSVSAASIYAKVTRDRIMYQLSKKYPEFGFEKHVGYGTKLHLEALKKYGPIKGVHRFSYKPIRSLC